MSNNTTEPEIRTADLSRLMQMSQRVQTCVVLTKESMPRTSRTTSGTLATTIHSQWIAAKARAATRPKSILSTTRMGHPKLRIAKLRKSRLCMIMFRTVCRTTCRTPHLLRSALRTHMTAKKPESEWRAVLSPQQFRVLREKGTEMAGTGEYDKHFDTGVYNCAGCNAPLYRSTTKFDSGCGWPAFFEAVPGAIDRHDDFSFGMVRPC